ncbi:hypothetical protein LTR78_004598 [Recurvomyces mirabilis]|uniref:Cytochrome P450 n=1 Tax=Recurvomyces mirabilis TaxID=574656 RepID=A0AAE0WPN7_9PEZI|nr:hypothetical protein LTR78_004598 [Recurvomyces mirabilis]KAK5152908.1 hypothetical protein LTS14_008016 [Recurvomyces mirabilis]
MEDAMASWQDVNWTTFAFRPIVLFTVVYLLYRLTTAYINERSFQIFAKQNGCQPPLDLSGPWYRRFDRLRRVLNLRKSGEDILDDIIAADFANSVGTVQRTMHEGSQVITTIEPANLQSMLATQFEDFGTGHLRYLQLGPVLGRSIFTSDGPFWAHSRALFRPQFSRDNINDLESTEKAAKVYVSALGEIDASGWTSNVDLQPMNFSFTLDTASDFLFGESVDSQSSRLPAGSAQHESSAGMETARAQAVSKQFLDDFEILSHTIIMRIRMSSLYWVMDSFKFRKAVARVQNFTEYYVNKSIESAKAGKIEGQSDNLLARLASDTQDREELRNQTLAILFAGRDTTAGLLGWCFMRLALHPDILSKLRQIILSDFKANDPITFAKIKGCRYLQHFLNEVLRIHPLVPINSRQAMKHTTLPAGGGPDGKSPIAVRKGQFVAFSVYLMQRRKDLWGEDALEFKPERWEEKVPAWQYLPFLGGPRICIGQQFALTEASYLLIRLLQKFDKIEPTDLQEMRQMRKALGLTMWPRDGVKVRLHRASS